MEESDHVMALVTWVDSAFVSEGWGDYTEVAESGHVVCSSVGFVLANEDGYVILASSITDQDEDDDDEGRQASGAIAIPRVAILSYTLLYA